MAINEDGQGGRECERRVTLKSLYVCFRANQCVLSGVVPSRSARTARSGLWLVFDTRDLKEAKALLEELAA
jgi:hypothetical protein